MYGNSYGNVDGRGVSNVQACLSPHSAFESSSDKLLGNLTPTRGFTAHPNSLTSPRIFSSISSTDGISPTSRYAHLIFYISIQIPFNVRHNNFKIFKSIIQFITNTLVVAN